MSENKRKTSGKKPVDSGAGQPSAARVVAMPKTESAIIEPASAAKPKPKTERIGDTLRAARLERDDDLYQIAEYLCIKPAFIIALENSRYDEFPADAYVIGFLRTYANFLGVDSKEAVDRYRYEMAGRRKKPVLAMPIPISEGRTPSALIMVGAIVGALLIYALWYGISSANRTEVNAPPPLPVAQQSSPADAAAAGLTAPVSAPALPAVTQQTVPASPAPSASMPPEAPGILLSGSVPPALAPAAGARDAEPASPALSPKEARAAKDAAAKEAREAAAKDKADKDKAAKDKVVAAVVADAAPLTETVKETTTASKDGKQIYGDPAAPSRIIIRATQSSWVMVTDAAGKTIFDHVLKSGDIYKVPNKSGLLLTTGNGAGLALSLDGTELPKVASGAPHVVRDIPLDPSSLMEPQ